jgi:hypothetical protein
MIQCPYCESSLGSEGSYRVHKHRFHKGLDYRQPVVTHEEARQPATEPIVAEHEPVLHEAPEPPQEHPEPQEPEHRGRSAVERGKGGDDGLAILGGIGAIAFVIILALLGKKQ